MARLLQVFGFLSVLFRGAMLTFQSLAIGGIAFLIFTVRRSDEDSSAIRQACLRWIRRSAIALAVMQFSYLLANSLILGQSAEMSLREVVGANFVLAGLLGIAAACSVIVLTSPTRSAGYTDLLLPAAAVIASSVMTSHAMARLDYRVPLVAFTALHQAATATWLGGLPYLLIAIQQAQTPEYARQLSARFSQLALVSVAVLASAGLVLGLAYVGSFQAVYGTSYGAMVATKVLLFGLLLFLGALNFQLVRKGPASSILASLKQFGEAEIGIGITIILTAASLTSLPPAADLTHDRVTGTEIAARMSPQTPRLSSPTVQELPGEIYAAQKKAFEAGSLSTESYVPGQTGTRPNTPAEKAWSEYNHHWAGIVVLSMGLLALVAQAGKVSWAKQLAAGLFWLVAVFVFTERSGDLASRACWFLGNAGGSRSFVASILRGIGDRSGRIRMARAGGPR